MPNQGRYKIVESVGSHIENVHSYDDLEKHHPSKHTESGRNYAIIDGQREEVRYTPSGQVLVKKDFVLSVEGSSHVDIPCPVAGYVYFNASYGTADIYNKPKPDGQLLGKVLHMDPDTFKFKNGEYVEYGQGLGIQAGTGRGGKEHAYAVHAHVELAPAQFEHYIRDLSSGAIRQGQITSPSSHKEEHHSQQAINGNTLGNLIAKGEGDYNSYNKGVAGDARGHKIDFSGMTIAELQRRQDLPKGHEDRLFAVGKYQIIPSTMDEAVKNLNLKGTEKLTPELQERIFAEYLIAEKRPAIKAYITGATQGGKGLHAAQEALASEWASVADPDTGRSKYGHIGGNKASIRADETAKALETMREEYARKIVQGLSAAEAYKQVTGASTLAHSMDPHSKQSPSLFDQIGAAAQDRFDALKQKANQVFNDHTPANTPHKADPAHTSLAHKANDHTLSIGDAGLLVKTLQHHLNQHGANLTQDGQFGKHTQDAVKTFQRQHGLEPDGIVGPRTAIALAQAPSHQTASPAHKANDHTLEIGDTGDKVKRLQQQLAQQGIPLKEDGFFGKHTQDAVKTFQRQHGLEPDGIVGPATQNTLQHTPPSAQYIQQLTQQMEQKQAELNKTLAEIQQKMAQLDEKLQALQQREATLDQKEERIAAWTQQVYAREQKLEVAEAKLQHPSVAQAPQQAQAPAFVPNAQMQRNLQVLGEKLTEPLRAQGFSDEEIRNSCIAMACRIEKLPGSNREIHYVRVVEERGNIEALVSPYSPHVPLEQARHQTPEQSIADLQMHQQQRQQQGQQRSGLSLG